MKTDVLIVGGGAIGSSLASTLSKKGLKITIIDKKSDIGKEACSGLISTKLKKFVPIRKEFLENKIKGAIFYTPNYEVKLKRNKTQAYVINRPKFDKYLLKQAKNNGAKISLRTTFQDFKLSKEGIITKTNKGRFESKLLIGADGAISLVRRKAKLKGNLKIVKGILACYSENNYSGLVELFFGRKIAPNFFAWKIPRGKTTEYGLAASKNHIEYFKKFLKSQNLKLGKFHTHPICYGEQNSVSNRILLVGDAAAQVKPFSGGGIIYGLISAKIASKAITKAFDKENFSEEFLRKNYDLIWKKKLLDKIKLGINIRNLLNQLNDRELTELFKILKDEKQSIKRFADMDFL